MIFSTVVALATACTLAAAAPSKRQTVSSTVRIDDASGQFSYHTFGNQVDWAHESGLPCFYAGTITNTSAEIATINYSFGSNVVASNLVIYGGKTPAGSNFSVYLSPVTGGTEDTFLGTGSGYSATDSLSSGTQELFSWTASNDASDNTAGRTLIIANPDSGYPELIFDYLELTVEGTEAPPTGSPIATPTATCTTAA